jgi:uncharacterized protein (TIGR03790 family)
MFTSLKRSSLLAILTAFVALLAPRSAPAGGSGLNVVVVVNQNSTNSVQLGNEYCEKRGVPPQNLFRMTNWTGGQVAWSRSQFETCLKHPLMELLSARGLTNQAQVVLLSMDIPYRITEGANQNSTTATLFYGFKTNTAPPGPGLPASCSLPDISFNSYSMSEMPFPDAAPDTAETNSLLAFLLTDTSLDGALGILSNGIAADGRFPTNPVYLARTTDAARTVREVLFDNAVFEAAVAGGRRLQVTNTDSTAFSQLAGLETGLRSFTIPESAFIPGSLADTLTSFAGGIFEDQGQTVLLEFLHGGAVASYGTVVEPCNYRAKFPNPMAYFYQGRGFNVAEAYYQSVENPYQGLFVGEPLSAPFAILGAGDWPGLLDGAVLSGLVNLNLEYEATGSEHSVARFDLYVDGRFHRTITNLPPASGNTINVTVKNASVTYRVPSAATVSSVGDGLAAALNQQQNLSRVHAMSIGDRLLLTGLDPAKTGAELSLRASSSAGSAAGLTTWVRAARSTFLDSPARGYVSALVSNTPAVGDWIQLEVVKTNGSVVTLGVTNTSPQATAASFAQALIQQILSSTELQLSDGITAGDMDSFAGNYAASFALQARTSGWPAAQIRANLSGSPGLVLSPTTAQTLDENQSDLQPRNHLYVSSGLGFPMISLSFPFDSAQIDDGYHELTAVATEGTSVRTQTLFSRQVRVQNTSLNATITSSVLGVATTDMSWTIGITANQADISKIEFFSTGGSIGMVSSVSAFDFTVPSATLGVGLHPFYARVTDSMGNSYRTETIRVRLIPPFSLALNPEATLLSWTATPGLKYEVMKASSATVPFEVIGSVLATNSSIQFPLPAETSSQAFYRVQVLGN